VLGLPRPGFEPGSPTRKAGILSTLFGFDRAIRPSGLYTTGAEPGPVRFVIRAFVLFRSEIAPLSEFFE
jgi:hypothetical protein